MHSTCPFMFQLLCFSSDLSREYYMAGTIMTISKDRVKPSPMPDSWKLGEIFTTGVVLGSYLAMMTVIFFWAAYKTDFFPVRKLTFIFHFPVCSNLASRKILYGYNQAERLC